VSVAAVARSDFRSLRRSYVVVGVVAVFAALVGLAFLGSSEVHPDPDRTLWGFSALVAWGFPLFIAPLTYLAIAGDRRRGTIKYYLGLPNSRAGYFLAKYVSRAVVAVVAVTLAVAVALVVAATAYENAPDLGRFASVWALSTLYALAMLGVFVAVSAATATRSRAMLGVLGAYVLLSVFWLGLLPALNLETLLDAFTALTGVTFSESTRALIGALGPGGAFFNALPGLVWPGVADQYEVFAQFRDVPDYLAYEPWFDAVVLAAWAVGAPLLGYLKFRSAELG
jgi:ABC-2 type transport system permease protein